MNTKPKVNGWDEAFKVLFKGKFDDPEAAKKADAIWDKAFPKKPKLETSKKPKK